MYGRPRDWPGGGGEGARRAVRTDTERVRETERTWNKRESEGERKTEREREAEG